MSSSARIDELRKKFDENPRRFFAPLANEYRKAGDFDQAVFICQEYLPQQPGHMSGHIVYGQTLFDMGRDEEARAVFETALTLDPENLIALKHLGDIARQAGDIDAARSWYQRVLEADPRNDEIMLVLESITGSSGTLGTAAAAEVAAEVPSESGQSTTVVSSGIPDFLAGVPPLPIDEPATGAADDDELVLEQSVDAEMPVGGTEIVTMEAAPEAAEPAAEPAPELLDFEDFAFGTSDTSTETESETPSETEPEPEPVVAAEAIEIDIDDFAAEPDVEEGSISDEPAPEPSVELATDVILGLPDDTPTPSDAPQISGFDAEETAATGEDLSRAIDQLEGLESFSMDAPVEDAPVEAVLVEAVLVEDAPVEDVLVEDSPVEATAESSDEPAVAGGPDTFATETMAELYAQQGHLDSALDIYDQLLERSPDDEELRRRADEVERQARGPADAVASPSATEAVDEEPVVAGPTIRDFFRGLLEARGAEVSAAETPAESFDAMGGSTSYEPEGSLDILFSEVATDEADDSAAMSLAQAFGGQEETDDDPALQGTPAHQASDELSLDHVFRSATPAKGGGSGSMSAFSLDQFFSDETANAELPENSGENAPRSNDDIAQFNAWLNGLKKT